MPERLAQWQNVVGDRVRLLNTYGPTETTVVATVCQLAGSAHTDKSLERVPIGRPISNVQAYILDRYLNPVPIGVPGELHIGGVGLARGYLNRPDLTAEKFIPNPFGDESGARFYKTGDLARYLPNGSIEFLGRRDRQVKVRGFRIELEEIEAILARHPAADEAVVMVREDNPEDAGLVAYVAAKPECFPTVSELRSFLKSKLPEYMVPSAIVILDALPLMPNGKIDRRALPAPNQTRPDLEDTFALPRTAIEQVLVQIWSTVLGIERVGIHDNFFDLGGHSLLATRVISRVREVFRLDLGLRVLFEAPTVAEFALRVEESISSASEVAELGRTLAEVEALSDHELELQLDANTRT
jgi:hypothetical protein